MRVISGIYRGKKLFSPQDERVRPTTDRIKETIFNILCSKMGGFEGLSVLDMFSGSGALGIEALSRGAKNAVFIDRDRDSIALTKQNIAHVGAEGAEIYQADYMLALRKLSGRKFHIIFADPPYGDKIEQSIVSCIVKYDILAQNGIILIEHSTSNDLKYLSESFIMDTRICGNTAITFLRMKESV